MPLVTSLESVRENIIVFNQELMIFGSSILKDTLDDFWRWYAIKDEYYGYLFGPSKFCGYQNMTATLYAECRTIKERKKIDNSIPYPDALGRKKFNGGETHRQVLRLLKKRGALCLETPFKESQIGELLFIFSEKHKFDLKKSSTITVLDDLFLK